MNIRSTFLPYCNPSIGEEEIAAVVDTMRAGFLSSGPKVRLFEERFATYVGAKHAIAVNSCTSALELALAALGIGPGDEVIVPTVTFCATANVVEHLGAKPVLVDVDEHLQISPAAARKAIRAETRAIIPVHYGGQGCDLDAILKLADEHRLEVIQDAAHAVGTNYKSEKIGAHGRVTAFSFYPSKNMTTGEGGMLTLNDDLLACELRELVVHGIHRNPQSRAEPNQFWNYEVTAAGYKSNLPEILAAIGIEQLAKLDQFMQRRRHIASRYDEALRFLEDLTLPGDLPDRPHGYHLYTLRITEPRFDRDVFLRSLQTSKIGASVHFVPLHQHPYYASKYQYPAGWFANADSLFPQIVSVPIYPAMSDEDVEDVIAAVGFATKESLAAHPVLAAN